MLKFREIGTYKNAVNIGYTTCAAELHNGMVVTVDKAAKTCALPTATTANAAGLAIVMNTIDKPEIHEPNEFKIEIGENPRLFVLESLKGRIIDMDMDQIATAIGSINKGDVLVANTDGKLEVADDTTDYAEHFVVVEKTAFGGAGVAVEVIA